MGLRVVTGELVEPASINAAKELDKRIRECLRDYVQLGKLLMEMRDNQAYRLVGPYDTFEDYCKDVEGLNIRYARDKIASYLIHKAIAENVGGEIPPPSLEYQVHQFYGHDGAIAKFQTETRTVTTREGQQRTVEVPVAASNPKKVAAQWEATVKAYQKTLEWPQQLNQQKVNQAEKKGLPTPIFGSFLRSGPSIHPLGHSP